MAAESPLSENPWAPPATRELEVAVAGGVWREGAEVVLLREAELPPRCVRCNAQVGGRIGQRQLYWHHPAWYLLIPLNIVLYALVALFVRHTATIRPGLCGAHRRQRFAIQTGGCLLIGLVLWLTFRQAVPSGAILLIGLGLMFVAMFLAIRLSRDVYPARIDRRFVRLKGAGPAFLGSLPDHWS